MNDKSNRKKQLILKKAKEIFIKRGYSDVTMKDIVEACEISRGGLYLYYGSTKEIFLDLLAGDDEDGDNVFESAMQKNPSSAEILTLFLKEQKRELCGEGSGLIRATYEFYFKEKLEGEDNPQKQQFDMAVKVIRKLIQDGIKEGDMVCEDPLGAARNIMYVLEGLRVMSATCGITEKDVNNELKYLLGAIIAK